jgi:hypothetical protein
MRRVRSKLFRPEPLSARVSPSKLSAKPGGDEGLCQMWTTEEILQVFDGCCESYTFPMLDNGYVYLAATRLSLHRSPSDWALVLEVFGFSPRTGVPDIHVYTFGSSLRDRDNVNDFASKKAYEKYLSSNPHNESRFFTPIAEGAWQDPESGEEVAEGASSVLLRNRSVAIPSPARFGEAGIELEDEPRIQTFELCRFLAETERSDVLATPVERRVSVPEELTEIMVLDAWNHPDVVSEDLPSAAETFQQLAEVLVSGDVTKYRPTVKANTHWSNWPEGGLL